MKNLKSFALSGAVASLLATSSCVNNNTSTYESVSNDPMGVRIYTLDNGLKVYMSVNKDLPRIQAYVGVRVGSKNDPSTSTGLAHYFEHLMFKGSPQMGTTNYEEEKPLLDKIEILFEMYRNTSDPQERADIYQQIDSVSNIASQYAISNEYFQLMSNIGSQGTNAWTSSDQTVYTENIPCNQLENWAIIQSERFKNPVIRVFHTELETVYEEKNRSLNSDQRRLVDTLMLALYPHHSYGTQSTLGTEEHLKNPSITAIKQFHAEYYVPNNMAICMAGDFNPDSALVVIKKYFGDMKSKEVPAYVADPEVEISAPIVKEVYGLQNDMVYIGFRAPGQQKDLSRRAEIVTNILYNQTAGLIDLNVNQKNRMVRANAMSWDRPDYNTFILYGNPKPGQSMEEVKEILLAQIDSLKAGNFGDWLIEAAVNNLKLERMNDMTNNRERATEMVNAFTIDLSWQQHIDSYESMYKTTKEEIVAYANEWFKENYVVVYKHRDPNYSTASFPKPSITPVQLERNAKSQLYQTIESNKVAPIEPLFIDYSSAISEEMLNNQIPVIYKMNEENDIFNLYYVYGMGTANDRRFKSAFDYLSFVGTATMSAAQFKEEMYKLACSFRVITHHNRIFIELTGLAQNMVPAVKLIEDLMSNALPDQEILDELIVNSLKMRADAKLNYNVINKQMQDYGSWGAVSPSNYVLNNAELKALKAEELTDMIRSANSYKHEIWYYGPEYVENFRNTLEVLHQTPSELKDAPAPIKFKQPAVNENIVYLTHYDSKQTTMTMSSRGVLYDRELTPMVRLYNAYFNSIAFQDLREARGLAYSVYSGYMNPQEKEQYYINQSMIGTQNDKLKIAIDQFQEILTKMPESKELFEAEKQGLETTIRTSRITRSDLLFSFDRAKRLGIDGDINQLIFEILPTIDFNQLHSFHEQYIKPAKYNYCLVGNEKELDLKMLRSIGKVQKVSLEELFGY